MQRNHSCFADNKTFGDFLAEDEEAVKPHADRDSPKITEAAQIIPITAKP